jgi:Flp pilus assembly protein TadD
MASVVELPAGWGGNLEAIVASLIHQGWMAEQARKLDEALERYSQALTLYPFKYEALLFTGSALAKKKQWDEALRYTDEACRQDLPAAYEAVAWQTRGFVAYELRQIDRALECFERSIELDPWYPVPVSNKGAAHVLLRQWDEAMECFQRGSLLDPTSYVPMVNRGMINLIRGDWLYGWPGYEQRQIPPDMLQDWPVPRWNGEPLKGQRIVVWQDQGLGDCVWGWRLLKEVIGLGTNRVYIQCYPPLRGCLPVFDGLEHINNGDEIELNYHVPMMSLPKCLRLMSNHVPAPTGIVVPADRAERIDEWLSKFGDASKYRIGLCCSGNRNFSLDNLRSFPMRLFHRLCDKLTRCEFWLLSKDVRLEDKAALEGLPLVNPPLEDFADIAALIARMDLVVTSDTATLHVAAESGKETWGLIPHSPDFRFGLEGNMPWYPALKLYRNPVPVGGWEGVLDQVAADIEERLK